MFSKEIKIILITIAWPLIQLLIFFMRFQRLPLNIIISSTVFLSLGFISAVVLTHLVSIAQTKKQKQYIRIGYLLAFPCAITGSLLGGLLFIPEIGVTLFGLFPLFIGMFIGYSLGNTKKSKRTKLIRR